MRFTVDSNILVYAVDRGTPEKHRVASDLMIRAAMLDVVLTAQALGEFVNVIRRKHPAHLSHAIEQAGRWAVLFPTIPTSAEHIIAGGRIADHHRLQFWDCVIWQAARSSQAGYFFSEDMQDGLSIDGMTIVNPFNPANEVLVEELLARARP